eukprot:CFRG7336T1
MDGQSRASHDAYAKNMIDQVLKNNRELSQKIDSLQKENRLLKKSVYDLSVKYDLLNAEKSRTNGHHTQSSNTHQSAQQKANDVFDIDANVVVNSKQEEEDGDDFVHEATYPHTQPTATTAQDSCSSRRSTKDGRAFSKTYVLKGHDGAVYAVKHSPCGKMLASGSYDQTIKLWDTRSYRNTHTLKGHDLIVSDVDWSAESSLLLSASYDATVKVWNAETGDILHNEAVNGFAQTCKFCPTNSALFYAGTAKDEIVMVDWRANGGGRVSMRFVNDAMVNSIYVYRDGQLIITGDAGGKIKTWDVKTGRCIDVTELSQPVSHVCVARPSPTATEYDQEQRYLAVNSYDNILRVYDRGAIPPRSGLTLHASLKGHLNTNWPIRSDFCTGANYNGAGVDGGRENTGHLSGDTMDSHKQKSVYDSLLLATGSAERNVYLFDVGAEDGATELVQVLEGHTDRVYSVDFHPKDPILATASADRTVQIWSATAKRLVPGFED